MMPYSTRPTRYVARPGLTAGADSLAVVEPPLRPSKSLAFFKDLLPYFIPDPQVAIVQTPQASACPMMIEHLARHHPGTCLPASARPAVAHMGV